MSYCPVPDTHNKDKVKVVLLNLTSYATKNNWKMLQVLTRDLAAEKIFIALKAEFDKLDINKLINFQTSLNNL